MKAEEIFMLNKRFKLNCQEKLSFPKYTKKKELGIRKGAKMSNFM